MKSERARKHLSMSGMHPNSPLAKDQYIVWRDVSIIQAVELAEEDMADNACRLFEQFMSGVFTGDTPKKMAQEFKQKLME